MSSDYIVRLRQELLRAGASEQARWRPARVLRPLAGATAVAAVAIVVAAIVLAWPAGRDDERSAQPGEGTVELTYRVEPSGEATLERTAQAMRERLASAGIDGAGVSVSAGGGLTITAPAAARAEVTALTQQGRVAFYDWERSVIGPRGAPAPADPSVTGARDPGRAAALTRAEAEARAAGHAGARIVRAVDGGDRWFALGGEPALTNRDIAGAQPTADEATRRAVVAVELTARGQAAFTTLTRELAHRGRATATGTSDAEALPALQHMAIVIDDRIVAVPFIDFRQAPNGLDGSLGAQIANDLTPPAARRLALILSTGPLPAALSSPAG